MGWSKTYEDIVRARCEKGAAVIFEYQHPQASSKVAAPIEPPSDRLKLWQRINIRVFVTKLESDPQRVSFDLLQQTFDWSFAHYKELQRISPDALIRVAMAYRDEIVRLKARPSRLARELD